MSELTNKILNKINYGWNLGNYFDCYKDEIKIKMSCNKTVEQVINLWHNPVFNLNCLQGLKNIGVNCLRIPVTWCNFVKYKNGKYLLPNEIFDKVKQIVDHAINLDFVVIIDMHHDDKNWLQIASADDVFDEIKNEYTQIWQQICEQFKNYNHNLVFEGMNELINICDKNEDWIGNEIGYKRVNELCELFVKIVRTSGGKNNDRCVMVSPYGAQIHKYALKNFKLPNDDNVIVDIHFYGKTDDKSIYVDYFKHLNTILANNIPIFVGEIGMKKSFKDRFDYLEVLLKYMAELNLKFALWDDGKNRKFIDRSTGKIENSIFMETLTSTLKNTEQ